MGLKYRGVRAVVLTACMFLSTASAGTALAADIAGSDDVFDGVVTVHWLDPDDGPRAGATIQVSWYHDGDPTPEVLPAVLTDAAGDATLSGVPRPGEGGAPVLLDVRGDLATTTVDDQGCTLHESWLGQAKGIVSSAAVDVVLETEAKGMDIQCPEPTPTATASAVPTPTAEPTPAPTAEPTPVPTGKPTPKPSGGVLGTTGTPGVTPPSTDTVGGPSAPGGSPSLPGLLALIIVATVLVPVMSLAYRRR